MYEYACVCTLEQSRARQGKGEMNKVSSEKSPWTRRNY